MIKALLCVILLGLAATAAADTLPAGSAPPILGRNVVDATGDTIGRIVDVLVDSGGHPLAALIDVGGFLGIGTRRVAVAWDTLHFTQAGADVTIEDELTTDQIAAAPEYKGPDEPVEIVTLSKPGP